MVFFYKRAQIEDDMQLSYTYPDFFDASTSTSKISSAPENSMYGFKINYTNKPTFGDSKLVGTSLDIYTTGVERNMGTNQPTLKIFSLNDDLNASGEILTTNTSYPYGRLGNYTIFTSKADYKSKMFEEDFSGWDNDTVFFNNTRRAFDGSELSEPYALLGELEDASVWDFHWWAGHGVGTTWSEYAVSGSSVGVTGDVVFFEHGNKGQWFGLKAKQGVYNVRKSERKLRNDPTIWETDDAAAYKQLESILKWNKKAATTETYDEDIAIHPDNTIFNKSAQTQDFMTIHVESGDTIPLAQTSLVISNEKFASGGSAAHMKAFWTNRDEGIAGTTQSAATSSDDGIGNETVISWKITQDPPTLLRAEEDKATYEQKNLQSVMMSTNKVPFPTPLGLHENSEGILGSKFTDMSGHRVVLTAAIDKISDQWVSSGELAGGDDGRYGTQGTLLRSVAFTFSEIEPEEGEDLTSYLMRHEPQYAGTSLARSLVDFGGGHARYPFRQHGGSTKGGVIGIKDTSGSSGTWGGTTGKPSANDTLLFSVEGGAMGEDIERALDKSFKLPDTGGAYLPTYWELDGMWRFYNRDDHALSPTWNGAGLCQNNKSTTPHGAGGYIISALDDGSTCTQVVTGLSNGAAITIKARVGTGMQVKAGTGSALTYTDTTIRWAIEADLNNDGTFTRLKTLLVDPNFKARGSRKPDSDSKAEYQRKGSGDPQTIDMLSRGQPPQSNPDWQVFLDEVATMEFNGEPCFFYNSTTQDITENNKLVEHGYVHKGHHGGDTFHANPDQELFLVTNQGRHKFNNETQHQSKKWNFRCNTDEHFWFKVDAVAGASTVPIRLVCEQGPDWAGTGTGLAGFISSFSLTQIAETQTFTFVTGTPSDDEIQIKSTANTQVTEIARAINTHPILGGILRGTAITTGHDDYYNFSDEIPNDEMPQVHICFGGSRRKIINNALTLPGEHGNRCYISKSVATRPANIILFGGEHSSSAKSREMTALDTTSTLSRAYLRGGSKTKSLIGFSIFQRDDQFFVDSLMHTFNPDTIIGQSEENVISNATEFITLESNDYFETRLPSGLTSISGYDDLDYQMKYRWEFGQVEASFHAAQGSSVRVRTNPPSTNANSPGSVEAFNYVTIPSSSAYRTNLKAGNFYDFSFEFNTNESDFYLHILEKGTENPISLIPVSNVMSGTAPNNKIDADIKATSLLYKDDDNIPTIKKFIGCRNFATVSKYQGAEESDFGTGIVGVDPMDVQPENYQKSSDGRHLRFPNVFTVWVNNIKYTGAGDWADATESDAYWGGDSKNFHKETETSIYLDSLKFYGFENGINRSVVDSISNFNLGLNQNKTKLPYRAWDDPNAFIFSSTNWIIGHDNKDLIGGTNYIPVHLFFNGFQVSDLVNNEELNNDRFWAGYSGELENLGQSWSPFIFNLPSSEDDSLSNNVFGIDCNGQDGDYSTEFSMGYGTTQLNYDVEGFTQKGVVAVSYKEKLNSPRTKREHILASTSILKAIDTRRFTVLDATKFNIGDTVRLYKVSESAVDAEGHCSSVTSLSGGSPGSTIGDKVLFKDDSQVFNVTAIDMYITQPDVETAVGLQPCTLLIYAVVDFNTVKAVVQTSTAPTSSPATGDGGLPRNYYTIADWTGNYLDTTVSSIGTDDGTNNNVITVSDDISGHITPQGDRYGNESLAGWKASITKYWLSIAYIPRSDDVDINRIYASMCGIPPETKIATSITDGEPQFGMPRVVTCTDHGFETDDKCVITDCSITAVNNKKHLITKIDNDRFYLRSGAVGSREASKTVTAASKSSSTMSVTAANHGYITGDKVDLDFSDSNFNATEAIVTVTGDAAASATITNTDNGELLSGGATVITIIAIGDGTFSETENVTATAHASVTTSDGSDSGTFAVGASGSDTMANLATFLNSHAKLTSTSSGDVTTITQARKGTAGNTTITIVDPGTDGLSISQQFTGGVDSDAFTYTTLDEITLESDADTISAAATTTITFSAQPNDNSRLTLKDTAGNKVIYEFDQAGVQSDGSDYSGNVIQVGAASGANSDYALRLLGAINNTTAASNSLTLNITASQSSGVVTLTQDTAGRAGNSHITDTTGAAATATLTFYAGDVAEIGDTLTLISADGASLVYTWVAAADADAATRQIHASNTATTQVDSLNNAIVHGNNHGGRITCSQSGSGLVLNLTQVDKHSGGNTSVTVTGATTGQINPTDFTGGGTAGIVVANSNSFDGGRENLSGIAKKLQYKFSPATTGGDSASTATIYTMQPAFTTLGGTVNESLYSDAYINNPHVLSFTNPENSIVNLGKDYGFGNYDDEKDTGGQAGQKIASSANILYRINIDGVVNADGIEFNDTKSYLISTLNTMSKNVITIGTANSATVSYRPYAIFKLEDELPTAPDGFMVKPNKDNAFYPEFTWTTGDPDLWYGLLIISDKIINNQYHDAVIHYPLNETGIHGTVATPPTEKISGITTDISGALYDEEGLAGHCLNFDGATNYVECNTAASSDPTSECTTEMSIVVHIVPDSASDQRYIVSQSHVNGQEKFHLRLNASNQVEARVHFAAGANYIELTGSSILPANGEIPTNIILTVDTTLKSGNAKLFINGKLEDQTGVALAAGTSNNWQIGQNINGGNSALYIGNRPYSGDSGFDGKIEEVAVYKKCIYPVTPSDGKFLFTKPISELVTAQTVAQSKSNTAKLFIKDYHNIRGETTADVTSTSLISWRKAAFALNTTNG